MAKAAEPQFVGMDVAKAQLMISLDGVPAESIPNKRWSDPPPAQSVWGRRAWPAMQAKCRLPGAVITSAAWTGA